MPGEVAAAVAFLASLLRLHISMELILPVDGGRTKSLYNHEIFKL